MTYNAAERSSIRRAEKAAKLAEQNRGVILRSIASSVEGRRYLWDSLSESHIFSTTFAGDALRSAFLEGERNAGLKLLNDIVQFCPEEFIQMMREANGRRDSDNASGTAGEQRSSEGRDGDVGEPSDAFADNRDSEGNPAFDGYDKD